MSSDINEVKRLKEILCRKKVKKIKKKYESIEKRIYRKMLECDDNEDVHYIVKCSFIEFKKRYYSEMYKRIDEIINGYIGDLEPSMREFVYEKKRTRVFEVMILIKNILNKNKIRWALMDDYIENRKKCLCPEYICISICRDNIDEAFSIFNVIGDRKGSNVYAVNDVEVHLSLGYSIDNRSYDLMSGNIGYCNLEGEDIPVLTGPYKA